MPTNKMYSVPPAFGYMLKHARTTAGLTLQNVSNSTGLAVSTISETESGKRRVSAVELYMFSRLYSRPITYFFEEDESSASFAVLLRAANNIAVKRETFIKFHELCLNYRHLRKIVGAPEMPSPPDYSDSKLTSLEDAEDIAESERSSLGLDGQPIRDICELLGGKRGAKVFHMPEDSEAFSGAFAYDENLGPCFLINSNQPVLRRAFTAAHEYAHCIAHRDQLAHIDSSTTFESRNPRERFANTFAAAFLMPRRTVNEVLSQLVSRHSSSITPEIIIRLALYFGVSFEAAGWRLVSMRRLPLSHWQHLLTEKYPSSPTARLLGYHNEIEEVDLLPRNYTYLAYAAYKAKHISFERLAELLQRNYYELEEEFALENRSSND